MSHSFIFIPAFPLRRVVGASILRRTQNTSWSTAISGSSVGS